jgi:hypothetical protein
VAFFALTDRRLMMPYQLLRRGGSGTCHYGHDSIMHGGSDEDSVEDDNEKAATVWSSKNQ